MDHFTKLKIQLGSSFNGSNKKPNENLLPSNETLKTI